MRSLITGMWISWPIHLAAKLGISDHLVDGPKSIEELSNTTETHPRSLYRILRALASVGIYSERADKKFELTPMAECLKTGQLRTLAIMYHQDWHNRAWANVMHSVKTGDAAFNKQFGMPIYQWLEENPT